MYVLSPFFLVSYLSSVQWNGIYNAYLWRNESFVTSNFAREKVCVELFFYINGKNLIIEYLSDFPMDQTFLKEVKD